MKLRARTTYLSKAQIEQAIAATRSNRSAASYLKVSYHLYSKFAKMHTNAEGKTLFASHTNQGGRGITKPKHNKRKHKLDDVLMGRVPNFPREKLFARILLAGYMEEKCNNCGYCQKRATDLKSPLLLHFLDGNLKNYMLSNLEILCFNCYFVLIGNFSNRDLKRNIKVGVDLDVTYSASNDISDLEINPERVITGSSDIEQTCGDILTDEEKEHILKGLRDL